MFKRFFVLPGLLSACFAFLSTSSARADLPPVPTQSLLNMWHFNEPDWFSLFGGSPLAVTNVSTAHTFAPALLVDTNVPAWLVYPLVDTNGMTNLTLDTGTVCFGFSPDWSSVDQGGTGPGDAARFIEVGQWTSNASYGWWSLYLNADGTSLSFGSQTNGAGTNYLSAPVSWVSNTWHSIGLAYSGSNTVLYVDGVRATNGDGVVFWPGGNATTNGIFFGSDGTGTAQVRGQLYHLSTYNYAQGDVYFSTAWNGLEVLSGGDGRGAIVSDPPSGTCVTGGAVYMTNMVANFTNGSGAFTFSIEGGTAGAWYDVFGTTNLTGTNMPYGTWTWLGQGTNCGRYTVTNQATTNTVYVLGTPLLGTNGSGLTQAYINLVHPSGTNDGFGVLYGWYQQYGLDPMGAGVATQDPDGDGLLNWQEFGWGTNPFAAESFTIRVSQPGGFELP